LREVTERPEGVRVGILKVVGTNKELILKKSSELIENKKEYQKMINIENPYGDGKSSARILKYINYYFGFTNKLPVEFK